MIYGAGSVASTADLNNKNTTSNSNTDPQQRRTVS